MTWRVARRGISWRLRLWTFFYNLWTFTKLTFASWFLPFWVAFLFQRFLSKLLVNRRQRILSTLSTWLLKWQCWHKILPWHNSVSSAILFGGRFKLRFIDLILQLIILILFCLDQFLQLFLIISKHIKLNLTH
jgi:hypothetical protein